MTGTKNGRMRPNNRANSDGDRDISAFRFLTRGVQLMLLTPPTETDRTAVPRKRRNVQEVIFPDASRSCVSHTRSSDERRTGGRPSCRCEDKISRRVPIWQEGLNATRSVLSKPVLRDTVLSSLCWSRAETNLKKTDSANVTKQLFHSSKKVSEDYYVGSLVDWQQVSNLLPPPDSLKWHTHTI